ncbi:hypothetical protein [Hydrogenophaga crocea]|uniref:Uncharacterized protein n=1 Tax=Hydrogenophaga crocea TaxID=2716225 RepID=A0A6G8IH49_9BURK|nr:hypothetical protein [Hydrogenophaga crocea]QIM52514.1 hypothetical protein G9Q37_10345 [Hydrogenophaga crocea]
MKLRLPCMQCFQELGRPTDEMLPVELRDDGLYEATCERGHTTVTAIQEQKYEVLFDLAAMALLDGYPREAIASMAAALERFYEFYVFVLSLEHKVDPNAFAATWKLVDNQSERQFGAYLFASLLYSPNTVPKVIEEEQPLLPGIAKGQTRTWRSFRNAVVHKGYMPSTAECLVYGDLVYRHITELTLELKRSCAESLQRANFAHLSKAHGGGKSVSTMSIPTLLSFVREERPASLAEALKELEKYRTWLHHK